MDVYSVNTALLTHMLSECECVKTRSSVYASGWWLDANAWQSVWRMFVGNFSTPNQVCEKKQLTDKRQAQAQENMDKRKKSELEVDSSPKFKNVMHSNVSWF